MSDTVDLLEKTGVIDYVKKHLTGVLVGLATAAIGFFGLGYMGGGYATASQLRTVETLSITETQKIAKTHADDTVVLKALIIEQNALMRKERADDEIFALDMKKDLNGRLTKEDAALRNRYERRLAELK